MDQLFRTIGDQISPDELTVWRDMIAFVAPLDAIDQWSMDLRSKADGYSILKYLEDNYLIRTDDTRLLEEMVAVLHRADDLLMAAVKLFVAAQQNPAKQNEDSLEKLIHRIAFKERLGQDWKIFARGGLRLCPSDMDELAHRAQQQQLDLCSLADEAMQMWRKRQGSSASAAALLKALQSSGRKDIADRISDSL